MAFSWVRKGCFRFMAEIALRQFAPGHPPNSARPSNVASEIRWTLTLRLPLIKEKGPERDDVQDQQ